MVQLLGLVLLSFCITSILLVPFIDLLFYLKSKYKKIENSKTDELTPIHNQILGGKDIDVPVGGGIIIILVVILLSILASLYIDYAVSGYIYVLVFTLLSFGLIGFIDDIRKIFSSISGKYSGLRSRYILIMQLFFALLVSCLLYFYIGLNNIFLPVFGNLILGAWFIPMSVFIIVAFSNAYNISDGLDGLSTGLLTICLFAFLVLAHSVFNLSLSIFVGIWIGALIAYLYFNVFPARIYLGDAGAYGFGATLAVVGLMSGKVLGLGVIGGVYIIIVASSLLQIFSKKVFKRKIFPVAPIHMYFKYIGWEEPKIVVRFWLAGAIFAILGLWLSLISN